MDPQHAAADDEQQQEEYVAAVPQTTTFCPFCNVRLSFPAGSALIKCPSCTNTLDPNSAHQTRCTGCQCLLTYPPQSLYIQCPKCYNTMDPRQLGLLGSASTPVRDGLGPTGIPNSTGASSSEPKKRRDPNAPKAVCNAYMIFCKTRRGELKTEMPELPFGKIGAKLGEMWRNMTNEEKRPYEDRAAVDRERYRREMLNYSAGRGDGGRESKRARHSHDDDHAAAADDDGGKQAAQAARTAARRRRERKAREEAEAAEDEDEEEAEQSASHSEEPEEEDEE